MTPCRHCSAPIADDAETCQFCGFITARGVALKDARAQREEAEAKQQQFAQTAQAQAARLSAQAEASRVNQASLLWSILGTVLCCVFPVGPVVGLIYALKARGLGKTHGFSPPLGGLIVSVAGLLVAGSLWTMLGVMAVKEQTRKTELRKAIGSAEVLDLKTACRLAELELLQTDYEGFDVFSDIDCDSTGDLEADGSEATLRDVRFIKSTEPTPFVACFRRNATHWVVKQLRADEDCDAPPPPPKKKGTAKQ
jgi:hypothetical protein